METIYDHRSTPLYHSLTGNQRRPTIEANSGGWSTFSAVAWTPPSISTSSWASSSSSTSPNVFEEAHVRLEAERDQGAAPEDPDEYWAQGIFWVPPEARWEYLRNQGRQPSIGRLVDNAMIAVERDNEALKEVLSRDYGRYALDKERLGRVVDGISNIKIGGAEAQATDVLVQVYEYFLEQVALAEGREGREFYTPRSVVRLLVQMPEPYQGRVYDPCCSSSGMLV